MTKIQIELPDAISQAAQAAGLLTPQALDRLLSNALRKHQALDEALFLLEATRRKASVDDALAEQAPLAATTALTTAAGFGALVVCRFGGLVDVGKVGALGSAAGLLCALVVIPAGFRVWMSRGRRARDRRT